MKRALAHHKLILRRKENKVIITGINDTSSEFNVLMEYGYVCFDGKYNSKSLEINLQPFTRTVLLEFDMPSEDLQNGVVFARADKMPLALLRTGDFKDYNLLKSDVFIEKIETVGNNHHVTIKSTGFSHAVHFSLDPSIHLNDEYFDMLPEETREIIIYNAAGKVSTDDLRIISVVNGKG